MSVDTKQKPPATGFERRFVVHHQEKQRIILRALEQMDTAGETAEESAAVTEMVVKLERLLDRRQRRVRLPGKRSEK